MPLVIPAAIVVLIAKPLREILSCFRVMRKDWAQKPGNPNPRRPPPLARTHLSSHSYSFPASGSEVTQKTSTWTLSYSFARSPTLSGEQCLLRPGSGAVDACIAHAYTRDRYFDLTDLHSSQGGASCAGFGF